MSGLTPKNNNQAPKKIVLKLKKEYESKSVIKIKRGGVRQAIPIATILKNPVKAIYEHQLEYLFENTPEDLTEVIRRVDEKKGLTKKADYQTRKLRNVKSVDSTYDVL